MVKTIDAAREAVLQKMFDLKLKVLKEGKIGLLEKYGFSYFKLFFPDESSNRRGNEKFG